jgi:hypothetical protein
MIRVLLYDLRQQHEMLGVDIAEVAAAVKHEYVFFAEIADLSRKIMVSKSVPNVDSIILEEFFCA